MTEEIDAGPLIGTWRNTNPASGQIAGLRIGRAEGGPTLSVWGVSRPALRAWGTVPIDRLYRGSPGVALASAFEARYEFGPMSAVLEANLSKGLLIIACMKTFGDGSGRSDTFSRDFFRKAEALPTHDAIPADRGPRPVTCAEDEPEASGTRRLDPKLFLGLWENTDAAARGLREARFVEHEGSVRLELGLADGTRPEGDAQPFAERTDGRAATQFHARIERPGQRMPMHGWVKQGVLVIAVFRDPAPSEPGFDRDFFYRSDRP
jgi:hypothetical protein